jgi:hypothetical protein
MRKTIKSKGKMETTSQIFGGEFFSGRKKKELLLLASNLLDDLIMNEFTE